MKRGTPDHPKTHDLAARLSLEKWGAAGVLECMWHFAAQYAQAGDIGRHTDDAIARAIGWSGASSELVSSLIRAGWLDRCRCHRLRIHDWPEHADQTVQRALSKRDQTFLACYEDPSSKLAPDEPETSQPLPLPLPLPGRAAAPADLPANETPALQQGNGSVQASVTAPDTTTIRKPDPKADEEVASELARLGEPEQLQAVRAEIMDLVAWCVKELNEDGQRVITRASRTRDSRVIVNVASCRSLPWLTATRDRLLERKLTALSDREARASPPAEMPWERAEREAQEVEGAKLRARRA
jgi:hypothetical protein